MQTKLGKNANIFRKNKIRKIKKTKVYLGIDLGGTFIRFAYLPLVGAKLKTKNEVNGFVQMVLPKESNLSKIGQLLSKYIESHQLIPVAICFGIPGVLDLKRTKILDIPNRPILKGKNFKLFFKRKFGCQIILEKDVNLILLKNLTEIKFSSDNHKKNLLGFYLGTGFGHALLIKDEIFIGSHGWAGELGHVKLPEITGTCSCGQVGCVEVEYSGVALHSYQKKYLPETSIEKIFSYYNQDSFLQRFIKGVAKVIYFSVAIVDPEIIVLGGGVFNLPYFPRTELKKELMNCFRIPKLKRVMKIIFSDQNEKNGSYGACLYAKNQIK